MIEDALVFALGALAAGLLALVLFPAFTRRAARLARRDLEASLPRSLSEIAAARDGVRASYAAKLARVEMDLAEARRVLTEERTQRTLERGILVQAQSEGAAKDNAVAEADARTEAVRAELRARDEALAKVGAERRELERRLQAEMEARRAADERAEELAAIASELRLALVASDARSLSADDAWTATRPEPAKVEAVPPVGPPTRADAVAFGIEPPAKGDRTGPQAAAAPPVADVSSASVYDDPEERARRVEDLAQRLKALKRRNAVSKARSTGDPSPPAPVPAPRVETGPA